MDWEQISYRHFVRRVSYRKLGAEYGMTPKAISRVVERMQRIAFRKACEIEAEVGYTEFIRELYAIEGSIGLHPRHLVWLREYETGVPVAAC